MFFGISQGECHPQLEPNVVTKNYFHFFTPKQVSFVLKMVLIKWKVSKLADS